MSADAIRVPEPTSNAPSAEPGESKGSVGHARTDSAESTAGAGPKHTTLPFVGLSESAPRPEPAAPDLADPSDVSIGPEGEAQLRAAADAAAGGARAALLAELAARLEA